MNAADRARKPAGRGAAVRGRGKPRARQTRPDFRRGRRRKVGVLEEFAQNFDGAHWLWAGCDGLFTPAALGPLLDIATQLDGDLFRLCRAEAKRDQLYAALLRQLSEMRTLTVLVIEDLHWADEATLDLLSYLGRRIQHLPVLLLVTYRDDALVSNDPLRLTLGG